MRYAIIGVETNGVEARKYTLNTLNWVGFPYLKTTEIDFLPYHVVAEHECRYDCIFLIPPMKTSKEIEKQQKEIMKLFSDNKYRYKLVYIEDSNIFEEVSRISQHIICMNPWQNFFTHAMFFDVDGTLFDFGGPIKPKDIKVPENVITGYISNRKDETLKKDVEILNKKYKLFTHPIPKKEWKVNLLRFVRHVYRNLPPTNFYYVGDKKSDAEESLTAGWIYLTPKEYLDGFWLKGFQVDKSRFRGKTK